jgi:hypothetical protein
MRCTLLQKSINSESSNIPNPFTVENLHVLQNLQVNNNVTTLGNITAEGNINCAGTLQTLNLAVQNDVSVLGSVTVVGGLQVTENSIFSSIETSGLIATGTSVISNFTEASTGVRTVNQASTAITTLDKVLLLNSTGAGGPFVITPTDLGANIYKITIIMTAFNTASFTFDCLQGTVTFAAVGDVASFLWNGSDWSLMGEPYGAIVT